MYNKYIKYKSKYNELKNFIGGGNSTRYDMVIMNINSNIGMPLAILFQEIHFKEYIKKNKYQTPIPNIYYIYVIMCDGSKLDGRILQCASLVKILFEYNNNNIKYCGIFFIEYFNPITELSQDTLKRIYGTNKLTSYGSEIIALDMALDIFIYCAKLNIFPIICNDHMAIINALLDNQLFIPDITIYILYKLIYINFILLDPSQTLYIINKHLLRYYFKDSQNKSRTFNGNWYLDTILSNAKKFYIKEYKVNHKFTKIFSKFNVTIQDIITYFKIHSTMLYIIMSNYNLPLDEKLKLLLIEHYDYVHNHKQPIFKDIVNFTLKYIIQYTLIDVSNIDKLTDLEQFIYYYFNNIFDTMHINNLFTLFSKLDDDIKIFLFIKLNINNRKILARRIENTDYEKLIQYSEDDHTIKNILSNLHNNNIIKSLFRLLSSTAQTRIFKLLDISLQIRIFKEQDINIQQRLFTSISHDKTVDFFKLLDIPTKLQLFNNTQEIDKEQLFNIIDDNITFFEQMDIKSQLFILSTPSINKDAIMAQYTNLSAEEQMSMFESTIGIMYQHIILYRKVSSELKNILFIKLNSELQKTLFELLDLVEQTQLFIMLSIDVQTTLFKLLSIKTQLLLIDNIDTSILQILFNELNDDDILIFKITNPILFYKLGNTIGIDAYNNFNQMLTIYIDTIKDYLLDVVNIIPPDIEAYVKEIEREPPDITEKSPEIEGRSLYIDEILSFVNAEPSNIKAILTDINTKLTDIDSMEYYTHQQITKLYNLPSEIGKETVKKFCKLITTILRDNKSYIYNDFISQINKLYNFYNMHHNTKKNNKFYTLGIYIIYCAYNYIKLIFKFRYEKLLLL